MLRPDLASLEEYFAQCKAMSLEAFLSRYRWPMLVIDNPEWAALIQRVPTPSTKSGLGRLARISASTLVLPIRPKRGEDGAQVLIGRDPEAADVVLLAETVSKLHAELAYDGHRAVLRDLGSKNGIRVDRVPLERGASVELPSKARLAFGALRTTFYTPEAFLGRLLEADGAEEAPRLDR